MMEYAQARIQARHGARPEAGGWAALHASITLASALDTARAGGLEAWVAGIDPATSHDDLECALRERLRGRISEVANWMPEPWVRAVLWTRALVDLPALQHLAWGRAPPSWMGRDPAVAPHLADAPDEDRARLVRRAWIETWRRLWPASPDSERAALEELIRLFESHLAAFARASADDAAGLRLALQSRLEAFFRRHALEPAAAFAHLALVALEAERLRGELIARLAARPPGPP